MKAQSPLYFYKRNPKSKFWRRLITELIKLWNSYSRSLQHVDRLYDPKVEQSMFLKKCVSQKVWCFPLYPHKNTQIEKINSWFRSHRKLGNSRQKLEWQTDESLSLLWYMMYRLKKEHNVKADLVKYLHDCILTLP